MGQLYFNVDSVKDTKLINDEVFYLILWETGEETWEPEKIMIKDIPKLINDFYNKINVKNFTSCNFHVVRKMHCFLYCFNYKFTKEEKINNIPLLIDFSKQILKINSFKNSKFKETILIKIIDFEYVLKTEYEKKIEELMLSENKLIKKIYETKQYFLTLKKIKEFKEELK